MSQQVTLRIDETVLHARAVQTLISYGISPESAHEIAFAICRAARRSATVETTTFRTAEAPHVEQHPYRDVPRCTVTHDHWEGPLNCGNPLPCKTHGTR